ncbi:MULTISPECIES: hypothetical protein [Aeromonas]|uniref:hypothetical protein n=1 Tax=Aeromonas TaxID=642 RepID=UPI0007ED41B4|nr:hypothetical protein [Aeromonas dhakensis]OBR46037.1 hypothetical protein A9196_15865 [Aeromonas dhakensis]
MGLSIIDFKVFFEVSQAAFGNEAITHKQVVWMMLRKNDHGYAALKCAFTNSEVRFDRRKGPMAPSILDVVNMWTKLEINPFISID